MAYDFSGKRILVTGAGQGIGKGIVLALAKTGARVVAVSKTQANLDQLAVEVPGVETICVDLSDWDATRAALAGVGPVDGLVNNAGVAKGEPFLEMTKDNFDRTIALNLGASINVSQIIAKGMPMGTNTLIPRRIHACKVEQVDEFHPPKIHQPSTTFNSLERTLLTIDVDSTSKVHRYHSSRFRA